MSEDDLRTCKVDVSCLLGSLRTLVVSSLEGMKVKNMAVQIDTFANKFTTLIQFLTQQMVLQESPVIQAERAFVARVQTAALMIII